MMDIGNVCTCNDDVDDGRTGMVSTVEARWRIVNGAASKLQKLMMAGHLSSSKT